MAGAGPGHREARSELDFRMLVLSLVHLFNGEALSRVVRMPEIEERGWPEPRTPVPPAVRRRTPAARLSRLSWRRGSAPTVRALAASASKPSAASPRTRPRRPADSPARSSSVSAARMRACRDRQPCRIRLRDLAPLGRQVQPDIPLVALVPAAPEPAFAFQPRSQPADRALVQTEQGRQLALGDPAGRHQLDQRPGLRTGQRRQAGRIAGRRRAGCRRPGGGAGCAGCTAGCRHRVRCIRS